VFLAGADSAATEGEQSVEATHERGAPAALELVNLSRSFGGIHAVNDVSITVGTGEIVGIIGPNGAGKTTLFDLVSGFTPLDAGRIVLGGRDVTTMTASRRAQHGLGRSFQDGRLFPALTVEQCLAVALDRWVDVRDPLQPALHLPTAFDAQQKVDARVDELVALLGLEAYRSKFVHELSTGSRRIVELGCLIAHRPTVILLDEPSSGIAQRETEALGPVLLRLRDQLGASLLVIEHDMPLIATVSDRLVAMDLGRTIVDGPPNAVLDNPDVIAAYLGTTASVIQRSGTRA
jgi:ABC-type branched-subunit amino acid transport system ATPase component